MKFLNQAVLIILCINTRFVAVFICSNTVSQVAVTKGQSAKVKENSPKNHSFLFALTQ
jgi:hypothetical protein